MYHFLGLGGVGMSALAHILLEKGEKVQGFDQSTSSYLESLKEKGAVISSMIEKEALVVYSSAFTPSNPFRKKAQNLGCKMLHRSELLQLLMQGKKQCIVTGSHGKTFTTALLSFVFSSAKKDPSFVIGGTLKNFSKNGHLGKGELFIAEGDESDGSFLKTDPDLAIVTSFDWDHMSYWRSKKTLKEAFQMFMRKAKHLIWCYDDAALLSFQPKGISYGFSEKADIFCSFYEIAEKGSTIHVRYQGKIHKFFIPVYSKHLILNALSVIAASFLEGLSLVSIQEGLKNFLGVERREEHLGVKKKIDFFDDYAHHPSELKATLSSFKKRFPLRRLVAVFEPHRKERWTHFQKAFEKALSIADFSIITDLFEPGEKETLIEISEEITGTYIPKKLLIRELKKQLQPFDVVVFLGAGNLSKIARRLILHPSEDFSSFRVGLIYGGRSEEHDISILSAKYVEKGLKQKHYELHPFLIQKDGRWVDRKKNLLEKPTSSWIDADCYQKLVGLDIALPVLHGAYGEDGHLQGFFSSIGLPFVGSSLKGASISMNKQDAKVYAKHLGINTTSHETFFSWQWKEDKDSCLAIIEKKLTFPVWVKPCSSGSSLGIKKVFSIKEVEKAVLEAFSYDSQIIIENHIEAREIEVAVLGYGREIQTLSPGEVFSQGAFHTYEGKYGENLTPSSSKAKLEKAVEEEIKELAKKLFQALDLACFSRIDFFLTEKKEIYFNEVNPIPGLTATSLFPAICKDSSIDEKRLIDQLIIYALYAQRTKNCI